MSHRTHCNRPDKTGTPSTVEPELAFWNRPFLKHTTGGNVLLVMHTNGKEHAKGSEDIYGLPHSKNLPLSKSGDDTFIKCMPPGQGFYRFWGVTAALLNPSNGFSTNRFCWGTLTDPKEYITSCTSQHCCEITSRTSVSSLCVCVCPCVCVCKVIVLKMTYHIRCICPKCQRGHRVNATGASNTNHPYFPYYLCHRLRN